MPKEEWGVKRVCPTTGKRFYDLNRNPIVSPYTGEVVELDTSKTRMIAADAEDMSSKENKAAELDACLLYTSPSPRDTERSRMPSSA